MSDTTKPTTSFFGGAVTVDGGRVQLHDAAVLTSSHMDALVHQAVFGDEGERTFARWLVWELGQIVGVRATSIHELYVARGQGKCRGFTVPAMNIRALAYDTTRAIFRTANTLQAGAFILEIARSEIAYTDQRPDEYVSVILAAALRENPEKLVESLVLRFFHGPLPANASTSFIEYAQSKKGTSFTDKQVAELCHLMLSTPHYQLC